MTVLYKFYELDVGDVFTDVFTDKNTNWYIKTSFGIQNCFDISNNAPSSLGDDVICHKQATVTQIIDLWINEN